MKANELRIGNWCEITKAPFPYESENGIVQIEAITIHYFECGEDITLEPIPLTEEWLLKFGFRHHKEGFYSIGQPDWHLELNSVASDGMEDRWYPWIEERAEFSGLDDQRVALSYIKYVHQLQNLYFALNGEELTITEL